MALMFILAGSLGVVACSPSRHGPCGYSAGDGAIVGVRYLAGTPPGRPEKSTSTGCSLESTRIENLRRLKNQSIC